MLPQHIAGLPVEEILLAAAAAAAPMIALVGWEIRTRFKRLQGRLQRRSRPANQEPGLPASGSAGGDGAATLGGHG